MGTSTLDMPLVGTSLLCTIQYQNPACAQLNAKASSSLVHQEEESDPSPSSDYTLRIIDPRMRSNYKTVHGIMSH